jgi:hypothetical protein
MRWEQGRGVIDALLDNRDLERVPASAEHAAKLIGDAQRHVASARRIADEDPVGAFQLLYDAARKALCAILENQGLRPTSRGGHIAVLVAVSAQLDPDPSLGGGWGRRGATMLHRRLMDQGIHADAAVVDGGPITSDLSGLSLGKGKRRGGDGGTWRGKAA